MFTILFSHLVPATRVASAHCAPVHPLRFR
jgi:hypothetical protein